MISARLGLLALAASLLFAARCVSAAPADAEHPGPGEKIVRSTVGTAPQTPTEAERAKLATAAATAPAPISALRPAPWLPPEWRAQFMKGGAAPARDTAHPHRVSGTSGAPRDVAGRPAHVTPSATKPSEVRTIGHGPRDASPAEIESKRAPTSRPSGGR
jgi:hypothetical protein